MTSDDIIADIQAHPERHQHEDLNALTACCLINGVLHVDVMDAHAQYAPRMGRMIRRTACRLCFSSGHTSRRGAETVHRESPLKSAWLLEMKRSFPASYEVIRHEDVRRSGTPDLSITGDGKTTWWEFKHGTPRFKSHGLQHLRMRRLAAAGYARYVLYLEDTYGNDKRVLIVHPDRLDGPASPYESLIRGHDHAWVCALILRVHQR